MKKDWRKKAEFFARLASLDDLDTLQNWEGLKFEADAKQLGSPWPSSPAKVAARIAQSRRLRKLPPLPPEERTEEQLTGAQRYIVWDMIRTVHRHGRRWIQELLDKGETDNPLGSGEETVLRLINGVVRPAPRVRKEPTDPGYPQLAALLDVYWILQREPFPFRRCPQCRAVFVPLRKQKYCTPACARIALQKVRRVSRREYMREYMREYNLKRSAAAAAPKRRAAGAVA